MSDRLRGVVEKCAMVCTDRSDACYNEGFKEASRGTDERAD